MIAIHRPRRHLLRALTLGLAGMAAILGGGGVAAQGTKQTLNDALAGAYSSNPTLSAARAALRGVNEGVPQALSSWRPRVTLNGSAGAQYSDVTTSATNSELG